ncbi:tyrosine-type recombinase/integrase [Dehalobacterium formicoaceticum]|uniref:tyrosine-type recombinase/integrase n=1 Tax=Dehalobacterium formicoaceticum TaxID=51515 RepID=UPI000B7DA9BC|nr:tyrosine-type recombinase/integrase [Dehalobacterium formicoaceticum]
MSKRKQDADVNEFWSLARSFLKVYLPNAREVSQNTVKAYKQALETLIKYLEDSGFTRDTITIGTFTPACIEGFMVWMSKEQNCKPRTCNLRLSAIKTFLRYCGHHVITNESISREVLELPMKKVRKEKIEYMSNQAAAAIMNAPDNRRVMGRRNKAMLSLLYDSAARVQELVDIKVDDLYLNEKASANGESFVTLRGKGDKLRNVNLSPKIAKLIQSYLNEFHPRENRGAPLFYTKRAGSLWPLSVDSVSRILKENADKARLRVPDIPERIHCHLLRKSRAMHLYIAGVPLPAIMELLGHASMNTTSGFYAFVTWEMVSEAMKKANEDHLEGEMLWKEPNVRKQLYTLD